MTRRRRRLVLIAVCGSVLAVALGLVLSAMRDTIVFFRSPTDVANRVVAPGTRFRLGGLVEAGSLRKGADGRVDFAVTDTGSTVKVRYQGLLPDLFREGQGVVTEGVLEPAACSGRHRARQARRDLMPREVADALKAQGRWQEGAGQGGTGQGGTGKDGTSLRPATLGPRSER